MTPSPSEQIHLFTNLLVREMGPSFLFRPLVEQNTFSYARSIPLCKVDNFPLSNFSLSRDLLVTLPLLEHERS